jgi:hypothetical protein
VAATSSLQLRAISNFGTPSATGTSSCEPNTIIEIEIGISGLLLIWLASIVAEVSRTASTIYALQRGSDVLVVFHQLAQHFARCHVALVVVLDGLQFSDLPDRAHRGAADLSNALGEKALKTIPHVKIPWRNARTADPTMEARLTLPRLLPHH